MSQRGLASHQVRVAAALDGLERAGCDDVAPVQSTLEEVVRRIVGVIDADGVFAATTDPETGLPLGAGLVCDIEESACHPIWEHEFRIPDFNKLRDLTAAHPVGDLRQTTGGRLDRSARSG